MKLSRIFSLMTALLLVAGVTGCRHGKVGVTDLPDRKIRITPTGNSSGSDLTQRVAPGDNVQSTGIPTEPTRQTGGLLNGPHSENREALKAQTVYFDLDSATIKGSEKSKLQDVAKYLQSNPKDEVLVEGHCDERGTEDYNLSLGERRALAIREALAALGASGDRVHTISYGETRPAETGHDESSWQKNRRGEFVVLQPAQ